MWRCWKDICVFSLGILDSEVRKFPQLYLLSHKYQHKYLNHLEESQLVMDLDTPNRFGTGKSEEFQHFPHKKRPALHPSPCLNYPYFLGRCPGRRSFYLNENTFKDSIEYPKIYIGEAEKNSTVGAGGGLISQGSNMFRQIPHNLQPSYWGGHSSPCPNS